MEGDRLVLRSDKATSPCPLSLFLAPLALLVASSQWASSHLRACTWYFLLSEVFFLQIPIHLLQVFVQRPLSWCVRHPISGWEPLHAVHIRVWGQNNVEPICGWDLTVKVAVTIYWHKHLLVCLAVWGTEWRKERLKEQNPLGAVVQVIEAKGLVWDGGVGVRGLRVGEVRMLGFSDFLSVFMGEPKLPRTQNKFLVLKGI